MSSSITPTLQAAARSAYRQVLRSSRTLFNGDPHGYATANAKLREAYELDVNRNETDPKKYEERVAVAKDVAEFLAKNVVQGEKKPTSDAFEIKIRPTTQLGDNNSIKKQKAAREEKHAFPNRGRKLPPLDDAPAPKA